MPILGIMASQISGHLFAPSGAYDSLATVTLSSTTSTVTFAGIPSGYKHLQIRALTQTNRTTYNTDDFKLIFNGDSGSNYAYHILQSPAQSPNNGTAAGGSASQTSINGFSSASSVATSVFGGTVIDVLDYANLNKYKVTRGLSGADTNGAASGYAGYIGFTSGLWMNTAAITSVTFTPSYGTAFNQYSQFALYGVK